MDRSSKKTNKLFKNMSEETKIEYGTMANVVVKRLELLQILKNNKEKHDNIYDLALSGYWDFSKGEIEKGRLKAKKELEEFGKDINYTLDKYLTKIDNKEKIEDNARIYNRFSFTNNLDIKYPECHAEDYERAIRMVELGIFDNFQLSYDEFERYVRNNWSWKGSFLAANSNYALNFSNQLTGTYLGTCAISGIATKGCSSYFS